MKHIAVALAGLVFLWVPAQDGDYEAELKKANEAASDQHAKWGGFLEGKKMWEWAKTEYQKAVAYDPRNEKAQNKLGNSYNASSDSYEYDPNLAMKQKVLTKKNEKGGEEETKIRQDLEKKMEKDGKRVGKAFVSLGKWCKSNNMEDEARKAFRKALEYDPGNKTARKELDYEKQKEGGWISKDQLALRKEMVEGIPKAPKGQETTEGTQTEQGIGVSHTKRKSEHFLIEEGAGLGQEKLGDIIQHGEHALAIFEKMFDQEGIFAKPLNGVVLNDKPQHESFVDKFHGGDGRQKEFAKKARGMGVYPLRETYYKGASGSHDLTQPSLQDWIIHGTIQACGARMSGAGRLWVQEGLAYWFTVNMKKTAVWSCVNLAGTSAGSKGKNFQDPKNWKIQLRVMVRDGEDPSIHEVIKCTNFAEFSSDETVKGWSIVDFLVCEYKEKFVEVCEALRADQKDTGEGAFQKVFGWSLDDLDAKWKAYVRANY